MSRVRQQSTTKNYDDDYYCVVCGRNNITPDPLEVVQVGGGRIDWAHGHCYAAVDVNFALRSVQEALELLHRIKLDAPGALKCIKEAIRDLKNAQHNLTGKTGWPNLT